MKIKAKVESRNDDGTLDVRVTGTSGPDLWQVEIRKGKVGKLAWVDEDTDEAITAIPDDEQVYEAIKRLVAKEGSNA